MRIALESATVVTWLALSLSIGLTRSSEPLSLVEGETDVVVLAGQYVRQPRIALLTAATFDNDLANAVCQAWSGVALTGGIDSYTMDAFNTHAARVRLAVATPPTDLGVIEPDVQYLAFTLTLDHQKTAGAGACGGCSQPLAVMLQSVLLYPADSPYPVLVNVPLSGPMDHVAWWQSGPVPARTITWGAVKALYR